MSGVEKQPAPTQDDADAPVPIPDDVATEKPDRENAGEWFDRRMRAKERAAKQDEPAPEPEPAAEEPDTDKPEAPDTDPAPEPEPEDDKAEKPKAREWAELEKERNRAFKMMRTAEKQHKELEARSRELAELEKLAKESPYEFTKRLGITIRELADRVANEAEESPEIKRAREYQDRIDKVERELAAAREANAQAQRRTAWSADYTMIHDTITSAANEYPFINADGPQDAARIATDLLHQHHAETGNVLDVAQLLGDYEAQLATRHERLARARSSGERPEATTVATPTRTGAETAKPRAAPNPGTLSNRTSAEIQSSGTPKEETRDERIERLSRMVKFRD